MTAIDLFSILPLIFLVVWALTLLVADLFIPAERKGATALLAATGLAIAMGLTLAQAGIMQVTFFGMVVLDGFAVFLNILFLGSGLAGIALAYDYLKRMGIERGEYYVLLLITICGMMLMAQAADLIIVFLALELLSIPLYIMAGFAPKLARSEEAALKYFLLGSFSSAFVLYGIAMIFGATARTDLQGIVAAVSAGTPNAILFLTGAALITVGFGFKVAAVPFHMWTPDVYQGAPSSVSAFMSVGAKAAGFAALLRVFILAFPTLAPDLGVIAWVLAALTMVVGNVVALTQSNIKRLLAYSSIAHAGYILMAFVGFGQPEVVSDAVASALFYMVAYAFTSFGAWAVVIALERSEGRGLELRDYAGLARRYPVLGAAMAIFMLSFAGVPPTLGFWGKFYLFRTTLEGGFVGLALIGLLTSVVSAYYYLRVIVNMYMQAGEPVAQNEPWLNLTAVVAALAILIFSLLPGPLFAWATQAALLQTF